MIEHSNSAPIFNNISAGTYSNITITLYDQLFENLDVRDIEMVIVLSIVKGKV